MDTEQDVAFHLTFICELTSERKKSLIGRVAKGSHLQNLPERLITF